MIEIPWLRSDVAANIRNNFAFYFGYERFGLYAACVAAVIVLNCMAVKFFFAGEYRFSAGNRRFFFNRKDKSELAGAAALAFSLLLYALNLFSLELSVFGNYDQMVANNILDMRRGLQPVFTSMRFNPAAGIDHNIIYGITHHYALIGGWVLLKQALCLWLLYRFFVFVPAARRLFMLAAVNFLPAVFVVNNMIHTEQLILIFVLLSFMFLDKYAATQRASYLLWFTVFANLAVYTKETAVLFYAGLLGYMILRRVFCGEIGLESFLSPFKTVARMPAEYMLFWTLFIYLTCYLLLQDPRVDDAYLQTHHAALPVVVAINKLVLGLNVLALLLWSVKTLRRKGEKNNLLCEGVLLGCTLVTAVVVFKLQVVVIPDYYKTYYLYLPAVVCSGYIFSFFRRRLGLWALFAPIVLYAGYVNYNTYMREEGEERRGVAEFIVSRAENEAVSIYVYSHERTAHRSWKVTGWAAALKYLYPAGDIVFKTALRFSDFHVENDMDSYEVRVAPPVPGDYILVHKINSPSFEPGKNYVPVYENEVYTIYRTGTQDD